MWNLEKAARRLENPDLRTSVWKYRLLLGRLRVGNVAEDPVFQEAFQGFFPMEPLYAPEFTAGYFAIMEDLKGIGQFMSFRMALERVERLQGTWEIVLSSAMAHMICPQLPIWDSMAAVRFGIQAPSGGAGQNPEAVWCALYDAYEDGFHDYIDTQEGRALVKLFDEKFPNSGISAVKKLDFLLRDETPDEKE